MYPTSKISFNMTKYLSYNIECLASSTKRKWSNLLSVRFWFWGFFCPLSHFVLAYFLLSGSQ